MMLSADALQLLFVDGLFICLAGVMGLWFRAWIKAQQRALDSRVAALESQQESLERLGTRLLAACIAPTPASPDTSSAALSSARRTQAARARQQSARTARS